MISKILISIISNNSRDKIKFIGDGVFMIYSPGKEEITVILIFINNKENMKICSIKALQCTTNIHKKLYYQEIIKGYYFNV